MQNPLTENISLAQFLVWEQQHADDDERYEWINGKILPSGGGVTLKMRQSPQI